MTPAVYYLTALLATGFICFLFGLHHERRKHRDAIDAARIQACKEGLAQGRSEHVRTCHPVTRTQHFNAPVKP